MSAASLEACADRAKDPYVAAFLRRKAGQVALSEVQNWQASVHEQRMHVFNQDYQAKQEQNT
jgi:hypothetical protein